MKKLKVGIIGTGGIAQVSHIPNFQKIEDVEVSAISDINKEKLNYVAEKFNIPKTFTDWEKMLEEDIDAVVICSPNSFHSIQSIKAMEKGKHVLCEKPICLSVEEAEKIFDTVDKTGKVFMGAFPRRFLGETIVLKKMIDNGDFGEIYYLKASYLRRRGIPGLGTWFTNKKLAGGGPMMDVGVHVIDMVLYLANLTDPKIIIGTTFEKFKDKAVDGGWPPIETRKGEKVTNKMDVEDLSCGFVKFSNGATLFVEASWAGNSETGLKASLFGTKNGAQLPDPENKENPVRIYSEIDGIISDITPQIPILDPYLEEAKHFIECIKENKFPITKKEEIISVVKIIEGIYKSSETGKAIIY
ncbi:MAG TPA: Gfo/Idh/MocA family oxidoreductase [Candidatus Ratteibacteria bacterium]|nr:Gfo/Idh/MocA family oxidoreductase [Candidatus Ratteibacteria bacterium]